MQVPQVTQDKLKIVDARSGEVMSIGKRVTYPDGEFIRLLRVDGDRVFLERAYRDYGKSLIADWRQEGPRPLVEDAIWVPLVVRVGDHPSYPGQRIGFIPS